MRNPVLSLICVTMVGLLCCLPANCAEAGSPYEKQADWAQTMLASRSAVLAAPLDKRAVVTDVLTAGQAGIELSVDVSGWDELWLGSSLQKTIAVWGDPMLIDGRGKKTRLSSLKPFDTSSQGKIYENKLDKRNKWNNKNLKFSLFCPCWQYKHRLCCW